MPPSILLLLLLLLLQVVPVAATNDSVILIVVCATMVLWVVFMAFWLNRLFAYVVIICVRLFLRRRNAPLWVDLKSLSISFLTGTVSFAGLQVVGKGYILEVVNGFVRFRYWANAKKHARSVVFVYGLSLRLYNASGAYVRALEDMEGMIEKDGSISFSSASSVSNMAASRSNPPSSPATGEGGASNARNASTLHNSPASVPRRASGERRQSGGTGAGADNIGGATGESTADRSARVSASTVTGDSQGPPEWMKLLFPNRFQIFGGHVVIENPALPSVIVMQCERGQLRSIHTQTILSDDPYTTHTTGTFHRFRVYCWG